MKRLGVKIVSIVLLVFFLVPSAGVYFSSHYCSSENSSSIAVDSSVQCCCESDETACQADDYSASVFKAPADECCKTLSVYLKINDSFSQSSGFAINTYSVLFAELPIAPVLSEVSSKVPPIVNKPFKLKAPDILALHQTYLI